MTIKPITVLLGSFFAVLTIIWLYTAAKAITAGILNAIKDKRRKENGTEKS